MTVRCVVLDLDAATDRAGTEDEEATNLEGADELFDDLRGTTTIGLVSEQPRRALPGRLVAGTSFRLSRDFLDESAPAARIFAVAAAAAGCYPNEVVVITGRSAHVTAAQAAGCRAVLFDPDGTGPSDGAQPDGSVAELRSVAGLVSRFDEEDARRRAAVGVGPHPEPWPTGDHYDRVLLADGDRRNVVDRYRYWSEEAIVADLESRRHGFHVAVENWRHDRNIGAVVRNANAFGAAAVHVVGRRRWNRRGAMSTDRYLDVRHHESIETFTSWCRSEGLPIVAVDNVSGSVAIEDAALPVRCVLVFGQEGPGVSERLLTEADLVCGITQYGSTRSLNAGVASGIAMYTWARMHASG
ncbi:MAG: hypothetical protein KDB02_00995 [Acidimicrobiales bacterium]|nr:hypothetical protein [Acidimicrobiales bacterium]